MRCPACDLASLTHTADLGVVPALCGVTFDTAAAAVGSTRGEMRLAHCPRCGHVVNVAYDEALIAYDGAYDNSLHHSATFAGYATELAKRLAADYQLAGATVLELGCGKGDFLRELCTVASAHGLGYDASYQGPEQVDGVRFVSGFLDLDHPGGDAPTPDFLVSRHVLEHLADPYHFLVGLRGLAGDREVRGYLEVPNASYDFATAGWDCIYPHVSYFNARSLIELVRRAGFQVRRLGTGFDDIFLYAEITTRPDGPSPTAGGVAERQLAQLATFATRYPATLARWRTRITGGGRVLLWGAGARGVAFLNAVDPQRRIAGVTDVNPGKWGRYLPVTGHLVSPPATVAALRPDTVIITNPAYRGEIAEQLAELGVTAEVMVA
ncbi:MAG: class I SAM-dependent methyltransferase [Micromonosporaceae bacterium]